ncbi:MAG TPA: hypothetical protein PL135_03385 [Spirochaetota bacterium]|nr:hypothetical protein [Spirochaetota bacterium]
MIACLNCEVPFVYRPVHYCGTCSADIYEDDTPVYYMKMLAQILIHRDRQDEECRLLLEKFAHHLPLLRGFDTLDIERAFRFRGLDTLLLPPPERPKGPFLKLVKKPD